MPPRRTRVLHRAGRSPRPRLERPRQPSVFVVGAGRMGTALAVGLKAAAWRVIGLWTRSRRRRALGLTVRSGALPASIASADLVILAVPDRAVAAMAEAIAAARLVRPGQVFVHCAGALDLSPLGPLAAAGAEIGSLHPLLAATSGPVQLSGRHAALDGTPSALRLVRRAARALGLTPLSVPAAARARYHAAATLAASAVVTANAAGVELLTSLGIPQREAVEALSSLQASSVEGLLQTGLPGALTGPVARGDAAVVEEHLRALAGTRALPIYLAVARAALGLARAMGADPHALGRIEAALGDAP